MIQSEIIYTLTTCLVLYLTWEKWSKEPY